MSTAEHRQSLGNSVAAPLFRLSYLTDTPDQPAEATEITIYDPRAFDEEDEGYLSAWLTADVSDVISAEDWR